MLKSAITQRDENFSSTQSESPAQLQSIFAGHVSGAIIKLM